MDGNRRLVYSTDSALNQRCPKCRELLSACACRPDEAVPAGLTVKLRLEKGGRGGKEVTVLYDLPRNAAFLKEMAARLKKSCGTGGTAREETVELQGDFRERLRQLLPAMGYKVKG